MKRVLFVDDEPRILDGLRRSLRCFRDRWEMSFAVGGEEALALLAQREHDVLVTDMRMPGMDGTRLLEAVLERHPAMVRIVLSGHFETETALLAVPLAHQFLLKPCDPDKLHQAVETCLRWHGMVPDNAMRQVIGAIGGLPAMPRSCQELNAALLKPEVVLSQVARIVEQDVAMAAKLLQLVNSAFFGRRQEVRSILDAVQYLGTDLLRQLVLSVEVFHAFAPPTVAEQFSPAAFQHHSQRVASWAGVVLEGRPDAPRGVLAGLLHDTGQLVLANRLPSAFEEVYRAACATRRPLHEAEAARFGVSHAEIGAYLLALWGLPDALAVAICRHHRPAERGSETGVLDLTLAIHIADVLAHEEEADSGSAQGRPYGLLDTDAVERAGLTGQVAAWRASLVAAREPVA